MNMLITPLSNRNGKRSSFSNVLGDASGLYGSQNSRSHILQSDNGSINEF